MYNVVTFNIIFCICAIIFKNTYRSLKINAIRFGWQYFMDFEIFW